LPGIAPGYFRAIDAIYKEGAVTETVLDPRLETPAPETPEEPPAPEEGGGEGGEGAPGEGGGSEGSEGGGGTAV
jgi:hypothetical protein